MSADELRERFEAARRETKARAALRDLVHQRQWVGAAAVARALGVELPAHQVVHVNFARPRP